MRIYGILLVLPLVLSSCSLYISNITIINQGRTNLQRVTISSNDTTYRLGDIEIGETIVVREHFGGDGAPVLRFRQAGIDRSFEVCYYTETIPPAGQITIFDDKIERRCDL